MKRIVFLSLVFSVILAACGSASTPAPASSGDTYVSPNLPTDYENALSVRNQLALGTLLLDDTPQTVTAEQAANLILLWQALRGTQISGAAAQEEVSALLKQIEAALTAEQLAAIREMKLTQADMQDWAAANGITLGGGSGQPGSGQGMSPEARATRQAAEGKTGSSGASNGTSTAIINAVIVYLESIK